jgi:hypothetical protein
VERGRIICWISTLKLREDKNRMSLLDELGEKESEEKNDWLLWNLQLVTELKTSDLKKERKIVNEDIFCCWS